MILKFGSYESRGIKKILEGIDDNVEIQFFHADTGKEFYLNSLFHDINPESVEIDFNEYVSL